MKVGATRMTKAHFSCNGCPSYNGSLTTVEFDVIKEAALVVGIPSACMYSLAKYSLTEDLRTALPSADLE